MALNHDQSRPNSLSLNLENLKTQQLVDWLGALLKSDLPAEALAKFEYQDSESAVSLNYFLYCVWLEGIKEGHNSKIAFERFWHRLPELLWLNAMVTENNTIAPWVLSALSDAESAGDFKKFLSDDQVKQISVRQNIQREKESRLWDYHLNIMKEIPLESWETLSRILADIQRDVLYANKPVTTQLLTRRLNMAGVKHTQLDKLKENLSHLGILAGSNGGVIETELVHHLIVFKNSSDWMVQLEQKLYLNFDTLMQQEEESPESLKGLNPRRFKWLKGAVTHLMLGSD